MYNLVWLLYRFEKALNPLLLQEIGKKTLTDASFNLDFILT